MEQQEQRPWGLTEHRVAQKLCGHEQAHFLLPQSLIYPICEVGIIIEPVEPTS